MNLKPNLWTLIFLLTAGAWFYTAQDSPSLPPYGSLPPISDVKKDSISEENFIKGRKLYEELYSQYIKADSFPELEYATISYLKLEEDEIASLYAHDQGKHIYAVPFIDSIYYQVKGEATPRCFPALNIAFSTVNPGVHPENDLPPAGDFYNFSAPCPPLCAEEELNLCITEIK